ncbi:MAG: hypothetical protein RLZZ31_1528 [Actinomycetota bacterium]|jgi:pimeloyl-ACP methyl ester carboxylesterase
MTGYDPRLRPQQQTPAFDAFTIQRAEVADGLSLAYVHEGKGGFPLVLLHGYPETKRIWWRNIEPLVAAGFEVIVPDLRGHGDSDFSPTDTYDLVTYSRDIYALVHDVLGHKEVGLVAGDVGGVVAVDMVHRYENFVRGLCYFDTVPPLLIEQYAQAGIDIASMRALGDGPTGDYRRRQGGDPDGLAAELSTPAARRSYIATMYGPRLWASPGSFTDEEIAFMTEPFSEEARLRAGWAVYQLAYGRMPEEFPITDRVTDIPTLLFYGSDDQVVGPDFMHCCEVAFSQRVGPLVVPGAGHFLQWERADIFNPTVAMFFTALLSAR